MRLGEPDESGRRRPVPIEGSEFLMDVDTVVIAIRQTPNPMIQRTTKGLKTTRWGTIIVNEKLEEPAKRESMPVKMWSAEQLQSSAPWERERRQHAIHKYLLRKKRLA